MALHCKRIFYLWLVAMSLGNCPNFLNRFLFVGIVRFAILRQKGTGAKHNMLLSQQKEFHNSSSVTNGSNLNDSSKFIEVRKLHLHVLCVNICYVLQMDLIINNRNYYFTFDKTIHTIDQVATEFCTQQQLILNIIGDLQTSCIEPVAKGLMEKYQNLIHPENNIISSATASSIENSVQETTTIESTSSLWSKDASSTTPSIPLHTPIESTTNNRANSNVEVKLLSIYRYP